MEVSTSAVPYLPKEVVSEILSWMPVKSLLQLRMVCKSWQSIISNPHFIKTHSDCIATRKSMSVIVVNNHASSVSLTYLNFPTDCTNLQLPMPFVGINFISSCNGIVCLGNRTCDVILLWNPSTKQSKTLPLSPYYISSIKSRRFHPCQFQVSLSFCFDSVSNDYKVLRIVTENNTPVLADLYSTSADSWIKIQVHMQWRVPFGCGTVIKGVLYWISINELASFDIHNEVFRVVTLCLRGTRRSDILDFKGSVAFLISDDLLTDNFSLWTMTDVCGKVSWRKQFTFEAAPRIDWVSIYLSTEQFVAFNDLGKLILYDYKKKETTNFQLSNSCYFYAVINHIESLVSIKGFEPVRPSTIQF